VRTPVTEEQATMTRKATASNAPRIVAQYREQSLRYHDFCDSMRNLLVSLLESRGFKYQIAWRIKSLDSIREKIARNATHGKFYQRLSDVEDVAGIRIVFYLESDKRRFLSVLLRELTRDKLKIEEHRKDGGYRSTHVLAQFGGKRLVLSEYRRFAGLKCELQLTSALYHAWSEIEHDILYKRDRHLTPLRRAVLQALERELSGALEHQIRPASAILEAAARKARQRRSHA
jgi:ppGpp synthetase/RelA/SpoT-type nucleotidyltranferase